MAMLGESMHAHPDGVADSPRSVAPAVCIDTVHDLESGQCATRLRGDLRIGNEFPLWDSIADVSAEDCRGHKVIVLTPTSGLQRQLCCIRAGGVQPYASDSRTALQQEDERGAQVFAVRAS